MGGQKGDIEGMGRQLSRKWREPPNCDIRRVISPEQDQPQKSGIGTEQQEAGLTEPSLTQSLIHPFREHVFRWFYKAGTLQDARESHMSVTLGGDVRGTPHLWKLCQQTQCDE